MASLEALSPFLSLAFTSLSSLTLSAGIVTLPVASSTIMPAGVSSPFFHLLSAPFLTVMVFSLSLPSGVYVISRLSVSVAGVIVAEP